MSIAPGGWVVLDGTANTRDVGGLPVAQGGRVRGGVLVRSDNLQSLSGADMTFLIEVVGVRTVLDLRTSVERDREGAAPLAARTEVSVVHLPLIPNSSSVRVDPGLVLPDRWADGASGAYQHYINDAPGAFARAVRIVADPVSGAVVVHCAAGKDRTGMLVAMLLDVVGVERDAIVADYVATNERIEAVFERLIASPTYADDVRRIGLPAHRVDADTMVSVLAVVDERWGGTAGYLRAAGVSDADLSALRQRLVESS